jgi:hypothetical protein
MQALSQEKPVPFASHLYRMLLTFYPRAFQERFGAEMDEIFTEAFDEHLDNGLLDTFQFLWREFTEAPANIFDQHLAAKSAWLRPYPIHLLAFTFGFILIALSDVLSSFQTTNSLQSFIFQSICYLIVGGLGGWAIGCSQDPHRKKAFALSGAIGFLLANRLVMQLFNTYFPDAFITSKAGIAFFVPFLYPILAGAIYGLFIGATTKNWRLALRFTGISILALFAGFFVNRLSAALMQSFLFPGSLLGMADQANWLIYLFVPDILEGLLLGAAFGSFAQRQARAVLVR